MTDGGARPGVYRRWSDLPIRQKGLVVVAFPLLGLLLATVTFLLAARENQMAQASVDRSLAIHAELRRVLGLVVDAETATRGFLLTGDESFLAPYAAARAALPRALDRLDSLAVDEAQQKRLATLRSLVDRRLELAEELQRTEPDTRALPPEFLARLDDTKAATDRIRTELAGLEDGESLLLDGRQARADRASGLASGAAVAGAVLGLVGGIWATTLFTRGVTRRVANLERDAHLLEQGLPVLDAPAGTDEIGRLGHAVVRASELLRRREAALTDARGFVERLLEAAPTAVVRVALPELRVVYVSVNIDRLFGFTAAEASSPGMLRGRIHPDDLPAFRAAVHNVADGSATEQRLELRLRAGDASYRWISAVILPEYGEDGEDGALTGVLGYLTDVDGRRRAEDALVEREETLRAVFHASPDIVSVTELDGTLRAVNPAVQRILGYEPAARVGHAGFDVIHPDDQAATADAFERLLARETDRVALRYRVRHTDDRWVVLESQASPLTGPSGELTGVVAVSRDVTDQVHLEQAQQKAREAAEAANRSKSEFLSRMSHELRTPLNAVLGFAQLLELDDLSAEQQDAVDHILKAGRHLLDLIDEVLDISRVEAGRLNLSPEPLLVHDVLSDVLDLVRPLAASAGVHLLGAGAGHHPRDGYILADRQRLKQILLNLVSNAIKYNRAGGTVAVSCPPAPPGRFRIDVADTGPGIRPEHLPLLFTPFERLGAEQSGVEGTGIGLTLSRRLAEAMGGTLDVDSSVGRGTTFWVELPAAEGPVERYERFNGEIPAPAPPTSAGRGTILHIEDNLANATLVERILAQRSGIAVVAAMQGRLGLELAREYRPLLILLDLHLPDMGGDEVLRRLRDDPTTGSIPVVMVSADATQGEIQRLLAAGAAAYLTKPLDVPRLLRLVDDVLDSPV